MIGHRSLVDTISGRAVEQRRAEIEADREAIPRVEGWIRAGCDGDGNELDAERLANLGAKLGRGRAHLAMLETIRLNGGCPEDPAERVDSAPFRRMMAPRDDVAERSFDAFFRSLVNRTCELREH